MFTIHFGGLKPQIFGSTPTISKKIIHFPRPMTAFSTPDLRPPRGRSLLWLQIAHIGPQSVGALNSTMHAGCSCLHGNLQVWGGARWMTLHLGFWHEQKSPRKRTPNSVFDKELIHFWIFLVVCFGFFGCLVWLRLVWPRLVWSGLIVCLFIYLFLVPVPLRRPAFKCTGTLLDGNHFLPYTLQVVHPPKFSSKLPRPKR